MITRRAGAGPAGSVLVITRVGWCSGGLGGCSRTMKGEGVRGTLGLASR